VDSEESEIEVLDTSGKEEYKEVTKGRLIEMEGFMIIFDLGSLQSFKNLQHQFQYII
jgi:GTPase SAR1 family protein